MPCDSLVQTEKHFERHFHTVPAVSPQKSRPSSLWEQSQDGAQDLVNRGRSLVEEHLPEVKACGWVHPAHCKNLDGHRQMSAVPGTVPGLGHGRCPVAFLFLSAPREGRQNLGV